ncbi:hypothetical protein D018_0282A, partial [Vibrio parahaemolyticus VP2007-007]
MATYEDAVFHR